jgi:hypothetical protein
MSFEMLPMSIRRRTAPAKSSASSALMNLGDGRVDDMQRKRRGAGRKDGDPGICGTSSGKQCVTEKCGQKCVFEAKREF